MNQPGAIFSVEKSSVWSGARFALISYSFVFLCLTIFLNPIQAQSLNHKRLLTSSANARVMEALPKNCTGTTPDIDVAAAASTVYLKGEALIVYSVRKDLSLKQIYRNNKDLSISKVYGDTSEINKAQKKTLQEYRRSLYKMREAAEQKLQFLNAAKSGFATAETITLKEFAVHESKFYTCYNEMRDVHQQLSGLSSCAECAEYMGDAIDLMTFYKNRNPMRAKPQSSVEKQKVKEIAKSYNEKITLSCANLTCGPIAISLRKACPPLRKSVKKNNSTVCHPKRIIQSITSHQTYREKKNIYVQTISNLLMGQAHASTPGTNEFIEEIWDRNNGYVLIEKDNKEELDYLKKETAYIADNWVTFIKDRIYLYQLMKEETKYSINAVEGIILDLNSRIRDVEGTLAKHNDSLDKLDFLDRVDVQAPGGFSECVYDNCANFTQIREFKSKDLPSLPPIPLQTYKGLSDTADSLGSGKLDSATLNRLKNISRNGAYIESINNLLKSQIKEDLRKVGADINFAGGLNKLLQDKERILSKISIDEPKAAAVVAEKRPENKIEFEKVVKAKERKPSSVKKRIVKSSYKGEWSNVKGIYNSSESRIVEAPAKVKFPEHVHNSKSSLWKIISRAYFKIYH